jgi:hypothetical protein
MALGTGDVRVTGRWRSGNVAARFVRLSRRRLALTVAVALLISTEVLFQPLPVDVAGLAFDARTWLGFVAECLLMGMTIMVTLNLAEVVTRDWARGPAFAVYGAALAAGSLGGSALVIALHGLDWNAVQTRRFWADAIFWMAIGHGNATIHFLRQRAVQGAAELHRAQIHRIALGQQTLEARLHVMRAQIEPHFIFNALANVKRLCRDDIESGVTMLRNLGIYLRAALPRLRDAQTTLGQEADLVSAYLGILEVRMGPRLRYVVEVPGELSAHPYPPMMLLTLAENAIKHGLAPSPQGGSIVIRARAARDALEVSVADSGVGFAAAPTGGSGIGLANTRARLAELYGEAGRLALQPNHPSGVVATIRMPLVGNARPHAPQERSP